MNIIHRILSAVLAVVLFLSVYSLSGCTTRKSYSDNKSSTNNSKDNSNEKKESSENDGAIDEDIDDSSAEQMAIFSATASSVQKEIQQEEIIPEKDSAYKLNPMTGGADAEAKALRETIVNAKDNLKVNRNTYYVSSYGNNSNDGKTPETAKLSVKMLFGLKPGDAVLFERGSVFRNSSPITLTNGVSYGAYGTGDKPTFYGSPENYARGELWTPFSMKNVWKLSYMLSDAGIIVFNHGEDAGTKYTFVRNLTKNGDYYHNLEEHVIYLYCDKGNPGLFYKDIEIGSSFAVFRTPANSKNIVFDNICIKYSGGWGITVRDGCNNIKITNCEIGWIGGSFFSDGHDRYGNAIEFWNGGQDVLVENCWIYQIFDTALTFQSNENNKEIVDKNIIFRNNLAEYCGMSGFEWWGEKTIPMHNISFTNNIVRFTGYGWQNDGSRGARHLQGPWGITSPSNMYNFVVANNIFDCALGGVYNWRWSTKPIGYEMYGNTYYQKATPTRVANYYGPTIAYASNQTEFEAAVKAMEPNLKLVKWLS